MKDLELRDILDRRRYPLTKLSVYVNGKWQFASIQGASFISDGNQNIYKGRTKFALIPNNVNDPKSGELFGEPGDYIGIDSQGELSLLTAEQYKQRFPRKINPQTPADTSKKLKNPNYITEIVRGSTPAPSNTRPTTPTYTAPSTGGSTGGSSGGSSGGGTGGGGGGY